MDKKQIHAEIEPDAKEGIERVAAAIPYIRNQTKLIEKLGQLLGKEARRVEDKLGDLPDVDIELRLVPYKKKG